MYPQFLFSSLPLSPVVTAHSGLSWKMEDRVAFFRDEDPETESRQKMNVGSE